MAVSARLPPIPYRLQFPAVYNTDCVPTGYSVQTMIVRLWVSNPGQVYTKDFNNGTYCFLVKCVTLKSRGVNIRSCQWGNPPTPMVALADLWHRVMEKNIGADLNTLRCRKGRTFYHYMKCRSVEDKYCQVICIHCII